jgi:hypothetical protein
VQGYAPLDQYLMGFRAPEEVPPTFLVTASPQVFSGSRSPQIGVSFDGKRRDITVQELIDAVGRRMPDSTVSQRRFRFAFLLIVPAASQTSAAQIAQIDTYRGLFEGFYERAASDRAHAETTLKRALHLSAFPAAGVLDGGMIAATLALDAPTDTPLNVLLSSDSGAISLPSYVTIAAGSSEATFYMLGLRSGVDTVTARPVDTNYETAFAKIQIAGSPAGLQLELASNGQPIVLHVTDANNLPYRNIVVRASVTSGTLDSGFAISDAQGMLRFRWTPGASATAEFTAAISAGPSLRSTLQAP